MLLIFGVPFSTFDSISERTLDTVKYKDRAYLPWPNPWPKLFKFCRRCSAERSRKNICHKILVILGETLWNTIGWICIYDCLSECEKRDFFLYSSHFDKFTVINKRDFRYFSNSMSEKWRSITGIQGAQGLLNGCQ